MIICIYYFFIQLNVHLIWFCGQAIFIFPQQWLKLQKSKKKKLPYTLININDD